MLIVLGGKEIWDNNAIFTSGRFCINSVSTYIPLKTRDVTTGMKLLKNFLIYGVIIDL